ncbi:MAG: hypothetical protein WDN29_03900 [Methylovirgula sp.]
MEAATFSGNAETARGVIEEIERVSGSTRVPWVETMLHYGKALLAAPDEAERVLPARSRTGRKELAFFTRTFSPGLWCMAPPSA